jgi:hypothetical protein
LFQFHQLLAEKDEEGPEILNPRYGDNLHLNSKQYVAQLRECINEGHLLNLNRNTPTKSKPRISGTVERTHEQNIDNAHQEAGTVQVIRYDGCHFLCDELLYDEYWF